MASLRDCVYGQAVGDALGVPFEFKRRGSFECRDMAGHGSHNKPAGTWSDDTSMALATCDSIRVTGRIDCADIRRRFECWIRDEKYTVDGVFDYGNTTARALMSGRGCDGEYDNGNGSLMRILPLTFTDATDDEVRAVSAITHAHPTSTEACIEAVHFARTLADGAAPATAAAEIWGAGLADKPRSEVKSSGYVLDTLGAAIWCLLTTDSFAACVLEAVNLGEDTDTTAAVAGGLAGIVYGMGAIPAAWVETLRGKDVIEACLF